MTRVIQMNNEECGIYTTHTRMTRRGNNRGENDFPLLQTRMQTEATHRVSVSQPPLPSVPGRDGTPDPSLPTVIPPWHQIPSASAIPHPESPENVSVMVAGKQSNNNKSPYCS